MKTYTEAELKKILADHKLYLEGKPDGRRADLYGANLRSANLRSANLYGADLGGADLGGADLYGANLYGANLYGANLRSAILGGANLGRADLGRADLGGADLGGANLGGANLGGATVFPGCTLPEEGSFIAFKKVSGGTVLKLEIIGPRVSSYIGRKCRCQSARVIAVVSGSGTEWASLHDLKFVYKLGEIVEVSDWNSDPRLECEAGIHFYMTRAEAEAH